MTSEPNLKAVNKTKEEPTVRTLLKWALWVYLALFGIIYPFYYEDKYYNMGDAKWNFYKVITFYVRIGNVLLPGVLVLVLIFAVCYLAWLWGRGELQAQISWSKLSVLDKWILAYMIVVTISMILTPHKEHVLWGFSGWYMGYLTQLSFFFLYVLVSRFWSGSRLLVILSMAAAGIVFFLAALNRFYIDPLNIHDGDFENTHNFVSTLGNITWYGCFLIVMLAVGIYFFWAAEKKWIRVVTAFYVTIGCMSAVTTGADSVFAGLAAIFSALFYFSCTDRKRFQNFWLTLTVCLASFKFIGILQQAFPGHAVPLGEVATFLSQSIWTWIFLAAFLLIWILTIRFESALSLRTIGRLRRGFFIALFLGIFLFILYLVLNTKGLLPESLRKDHIYLRWNDYWGDWRGGNWTMSILSFFRTLRDDPRAFLFGAGPDNFCYTIYTYFYDRVRRLAAGASGNAEAVLTCAHNEWLCAFINSGLLGGLAYLGFFISALKRFGSRVQRSPELTAAALAVVAYFTFDFFCYQQIISTPLIFIIIGIGEHIVRRDEKAEIVEN